MIKIISICFSVIVFYYFCLYEFCSLKQLYEAKFQEAITGASEFGHFIKTTITSGLEMFGTCI